MMSTLRQDLRSALHQARRAPGVTALIVLSIALGIGACTTIFCLVWSLVLRPLPFREPQALVGIDSSPLVQRGEPDPVNHMSSPDYRDLRTQNRSFAGVEPYTDDFHLVLTGAEPRRVSGTLVSAGLFELLGVRPLLGRQISAEDDRRGAQKVLLLGYELWRSRFGGDPAILGKVVQANTSQYRVIGVMPPGFAFPGANEAWAAMETERPYAANRAVRRLYVVARLRPGVSAAAARGDLEALAARLAALDPADAGWTLAAVPLRRWLLGSDLQRSALAILAAVLSVLLIACANISSLLLAQGMRRRREMALRAALGARPRRLVRQILTESLALAGLGGVLGIPLGIGGLHVLRGALPPLPYGFELTTDPPALGAACALSLAAGLLCGLAPALRASRPDMSAVFRHAAAGDSRGHRRLHAVLVIAEVALSTVLLIAASLSRRAVHGFDPDLPVFNPATMEEVSAAQLRTERLSSGSLALFGAVALLFAATGTYALLAAGVSQRRREIAVRLALGAPRGRLFRRLVGHGIGLTLLGLSLGLLLAAVVSRALAARLYGVTASDPFSLAGVFVLLLDVAFAACYLPARRALDIDPAEALRAE